jgi:acyl-CoA dehydrogenase
MIDFSLTTEQRMIQDTVRNFVTREVIPWERELINRHKKGQSEYLTLPELRALQRKGKEAGFWGLDCPEKFGGLDLDAMSNAIVFEEIGRSFVEFNFGGRAFSALYQLNDEQQKDYLIPVLQGERQPCFALSEPSGGSDARQLKTTAVLQGSEWVLNGEKTWISFGHIADFALVYAKTRASDGTEGVSGFLVDRSMGWTSTPIPMMGMHDCSSMFFDNVRVPARNLVGEVNGGFKHAMHFLYKNRWLLGARYVGSAERLLAMALEQAENRSTFGKKLADRENIQWMIAESEVEIRAAKLLSWNGAWQFEQEGIDDRHASCAAKLYSSQMVNRVVDKVLQIHGAMGYAVETGIERWYRDLRVTRIWEGVDEVQLAWLFKSLRDERISIGQVN